MLNDNEEYGRTQRSVRTATVSRPITPIDTDRTRPHEVAPGAPQFVLPFGVERRQPPMLLAIVAALVAALAIVTVTVVGSIPAHTQGKAGPTAAPTAAATPTATVMPTPTALPGLQVYMDRGQDILLQYPQGWTATPTHPGIQFQNDPKNVIFEAAIGLPDPEALGTQGSAAADAGAWVDYELNSLATFYGDQFQREAGPTPAVTFGGAQWQTGIGYIGTGQARVRVKVYATVHNGRPVILNLLAADSAFSFAEEDYFGPMLRSFTFLTPQTPQA